MQHDTDDVELVVGKDDDDNDVSSSNIVDVTLINNHPNLQGFGLDISGGVDRPYSPQDNGIFVSALRPRGLAERSGQLDVGDKILQVNGTSVLSVSHDDAVKLFISDRSKVDLRIHKNYDLLLRAAASTPSPTPTVSPGQTSPIEQGSPKKDHMKDDSASVSIPGFAIGLAIGCLLVVALKRFVLTAKT